MASDSIQEGFIRLLTISPRRILKFFSSILEVSDIQEHPEAVQLFKSYKMTSFSSSGKLGKIFLSTFTLIV